MADASLARISREQEREAESFLKAMEAMNRPEDLPVLYSTLMQAVMNQYGNRSDELRVAVASKIGMIPGHAQYLGEKIEALSTEIYTLRKRDRLFYLMRHVNSSETLETLGKFLFDDRVAEKDIPREQIDINNPVGANATIAAGSLTRFLGDHSPIKPSLSNLHYTEVEKLQRWWNSPEGIKYRQEYGTGGATRLAAAAPQQSTAEPAESPASTPSPVSGVIASPKRFPTIAWLLLAAFLTYAALFLLISKLRKV